MLANFVRQANLDVHVRNALDVNVNFSEAAE